MSSLAQYGATSLYLQLQPLWCSIGDPQKTHLKPVHPNAKALLNLNPLEV